MYHACAQAYSIQIVHQQQYFFTLNGCKTQSRYTIICINHASSPLHYSTQVTRMYSRSRRRTSGTQLHVLCTTEKPQRAKFVFGPRGGAFDASQTSASAQLTQGIPLYSPLRSTRLRRLSLVLCFPSPHFSYQSYAPALESRGVGKGGGMPPPSEIAMLKIFRGFWLTHYCNCYQHICLQLLVATPQTPITALALDPTEGLPSPSPPVLCPPPKQISVYAPVRVLIKYH